MKLIAPIKISYKNLMAAKFRSFLTILGIIIGITSVIVVMSIGASAQQLILDQVSGIGSDLIGVLPGASDEKGPPASVLGIVTTTLKYKDLQSVLQNKNVPNAINGAGYVTGVATIKYKSVSIEASYQGTTASFPDVESAEVEKGRFFTKDEETNLSRNIVLGSELAKELFSDQDPLGKVVTLKDANMTVIGVLEKRGSVAFSNSDQVAYVPLFTAQKLLLGIDYLNFMRIKVDDADNLSRATVDIRMTVRQNHKIKAGMEDDFSVRDTAQAISTITSITDVLKYFLVSIAAISLLVGGVGIMNIMLISVNQRIKEIGLRKAIGARNFHIVTQFLMESVFVTVVGGIIGMLFGIIVSYLASVVIVSLGYEWQFIISPISIVIATGVAALIGIVFGLYPARRAAKISPMEALRYE
ncbi:MAG: hypothetical protein ACD_11C00026G0002 [uncultured bacterium]|nr:MAG: hypothetical protein ACD_11C00026G0002 [uncultured bacterium]HBR72046.1 hypothetical protein [Candidatus Moranbacteria bacterium]